MALSRPQIAYPIPLQNSGMQAVGTADRVVCALVAALAAVRKNLTLGGSVKQLSWGEQEKVLYAELDRHGVLEQQAGQWSRAVAGFRHLAPVPQGCKVGSFTLDPYQVDAVNRISDAGGVLALGCGLGKTVTALAAAIRHTGGVGAGRLWITCPLNAIPTWQRAVKLVAGQFDEIEILSMDSLHKAVHAPNKGGVIIYDEAHLLGEKDSRRTKAAHALRLKFDFGLCLTGTMLHGGIHKALSILDLAVPGGALFANQWKAGEYFQCLVRKSIGSRDVTVLERPVGRAKEAFLEYVSRLTISMTKDSEAVRATVKLPEQELRTVELGACDVPVEDLAAEYVAAKIAAGEDFPHAQQTAHALCRMGADEKLDWLLDQMDDPTQGIVVLAMYQPTLQAAAKRFADEGISYVLVDGDVTGANRAECERKFQDGEVQVFLGQIGAAGISMNLQRGFVSVTLDVNWKASDYSQALGRTCRRGQDAACFHFDLVANRLQKRVVERLRLAEDFDASVAEYQELKTGMKRCEPPSTPPES